MRLIDADALMEFAHNHVGGVIDCNDIARFPTIEAEPVRHGRWDEDTVPFCNVCMECGAVVERHCVKRNGSLKRCPNCGARMYGGASDENA